MTRPRLSSILLLHLSASSHLCRCCCCRCFRCILHLKRIVRVFCSCPNSLPSRRRRSLPPELDPCRRSCFRDRRLSRTWSVPPRPPAARPVNIHLTTHTVVLASRDQSGVPFLCNGNTPCTSERIEAFQPHSRLVHKQTVPLLLRQASASTGEGQTTATRAGEQVPGAAVVLYACVCACASGKSPDPAATAATKIISTAITRGPADSPVPTR